MRHRKAGRKFGRTRAHRRAMFRNLLTSLVLDEKITTTDAKAKELKRLADKLITLAKRGDLHARRRALTMLFSQTVEIQTANGKKVKRTSRDALAKLFDNLGPRFEARQGGYTRVLKAGVRQGDGALLSIIEWTDYSAA
jgi:large subunit ribosomal protein L17